MLRRRLMCLTQYEERRFEYDASGAAKSQNDLAKLSYAPAACTAEHPVGPLFTIEAHCCLPGSGTATLVAAGGTKRPRGGGRSGHRNSRPRAAHCCRV